jgi:hypothetical protein
MQQAFLSETIPISESGFFNSEDPQLIHSRPALVSSRLIFCPSNSAPLKTLHSTHVTTPPALGDIITSSHPIKDAVPEQLISFSVGSR